MTTITLNNKNKTQFNFEYEHGLPYKKSIRPALEYGDWKKDNSKTLIVITLNDLEYALFKEPYNIQGLGAYFINKELWLDLGEIYLVMDFSSKLQQRILEHKFIFAFMYKEDLISSIGY